MLLQIKKDNKEGGGGQKLPILRRHSLWTAPKCVIRYLESIASFEEILQYMYIVQGFPTFAIFCQLPLKRGYLPYVCVCMFNMVNYLVRVVG